ncbi:MAG: DNA gyrase inhibitor YacG [Verrucomicrobiales bacterium]|nr:DNA gyrase inhibitor YacG [Verrucomicrobiales bacterium]
MRDPESTTLRCPTCRRVGAWFATEWGPFCSQRCKWVDLSKWLNEEHRIAPEPTLESDSDPDAQQYQR